MILISMARPLQSEAQRDRQTKLIYTIDMEADVIDKITFLSEANEVIGELEFSYMQNIKTVGNKFAEPRRRSYRQPRQRSEGILWLFELIR